ncbi:hypothetical protein VTI74DRAFT_4401 [Chaetomium olivicolor]
MPPPAVPAAASPAQEHIGRSDASGEEAALPGPGRAGIQGGEPLVRKNKDDLDDCHLERRGTVESCVSEFSMRRTNTTWSIAASTATDLTDPNSPDVAVAEEGLDLEAESHASSPRRGSLFARMLASQKKLPLRVPSNPRPDPSSLPAVYASSPDTPALRHCKVKQMAPRKSSLSRPPGANLPMAGPGRSSRRELSPSANFEPQTKAEDEDAKDAGDIGQNAKEPAKEFLDVSPTPELLPLPGTAKGTRIRERDETEVRLRDDDMDSASEASDEVSTPREGVARVSALEATGLSANHAPLDEEHSSSESEASDSGDEIDTESIQRSDDNMIYAACDQVLQQAFGIHLDELAPVGAMSVACKSMAHCLNDLCHIVHNSGLRNAGITMNETAGTERVTA